MDKWEYKFVEFYPDDNGEQLLNDLGRDGWELIAVTRYSRIEAVAYLKRRIKEG